jgi:predicted nucleic acid-binding protein
MILVDTNIPLRIAQIGHPHRQPALDALELLTLRDQERFAIAPQSLYEMYVVCTRPASGNGFGYTAPQALAEIAATRSIFELLPETAQVYPTWEGLIAKYNVQGKPAHDTRLVALMIQHRVSQILTFNDADFRRFVEIRPLNPFDVLARPRV